MSTGLKSRSLCATAALAGVFTLFSWRLIGVQVSQHEHWAGLAARKNVDRQPIFARRGVILSADGEPLAQNEPVKQVIADGSLIKDHGTVAEILSPLLDMRREVLLEKLQRTAFFEAIGRRAPSKYIVLKKDLPESVALKI